MYISTSGYNSASLGIGGSLTALNRSFFELLVLVVSLVATVDAFPTLFYLFKTLYFKTASLGLFNSGFFVYFLSELSDLQLLI